MNKSQLEKIIKRVDRATQPKENRQYSHRIVIAFDDDILPEGIEERADAVYRLPFDSAENVYKRILAIKVVPKEGKETNIHLDFKYCKDSKLDELIEVVFDRKNRHEPKEHD